MIKNTKIPLKPGTGMRQEALNILRYTLLLDYPTPILQKKISVPDLMNQCQECCLKLFSKSPNDVCFNFFGNSAYTSLPKYNPELVNLDFFTYSPDTFKKQHKKEQQNTDKKDKETTIAQNATKAIGFPTMILQHCILSSYHAVLTDLVGDVTVTSYQIVNKIKKRGAHRLYENNPQRFPSDFLGRNNASAEATIKSSRASDFCKRTKTNNDKETNLLCKISNLLCTEIEKEPKPKNPTYKYQLQFAGLYYTFCEFPAPKWKWGHEKKVNGKTVTGKATEHQLRKLIDKLYYEIFSYLPSDSVDDLYHRHIFERCFNFNLIYCILNNLARIKDKDDFSLSKNDIISIFNSSKTLPNTINRQYFIQYAFDQIYLKPESEKDFWYKHFLTSEETRTWSNPTHFDYEGFKRDKWVSQFSMFCNYMGQFVIPAYEWCFLNLLMESIELNNKDKDKGKDKDKVHEEHLQIAFKLLSDYIKTHTTELFQPIILEKNKDWTSLNVKHEREIQFIIDDAKKVNDEITTIVSEIFFEKEDTVDLNLTPLNRSFFTKDRGKASNTEKIHDFYIRLISSILS